MFKRYSIKNFNILIVICVFLLSAVGFLAVGSLNPSLQKRQLLGIIAGIFFMCVFAFIDYHIYTEHVYFILYIFAIALLLAVHFFGTTNQNATRWLIIGGMKFQPSELSKVLLILFFSKYFEKMKNKLNTGRIIILSFILALIPVYLILKQPNLSTSIVTFIIFLVIYYAAGLSYKVILPALAVIIPSIIIGLQVVLYKAHAGQLPDRIYQLKRIVAWLEPNNPKYSYLGQQQNNSVMAIGSGGLFGKGLGTNTIFSVKNANFVSQNETDFIFSVIGEELGFIGCIFVIAVFIVLTYSIISVSRKAKDLTGRYIAIGMAGLLGFQSFLNMGVATRILPNTGVTLPFISYGLTSMISLYIGIGIILNIAMQPKL